MALSKPSNTTAPLADDIKQDRTAQTTAAYDAMVAVKDRITVLDTDALGKLAAIEKAEIMLGKLMFAGDEAAVEKTAADIEQMKAELARINLGQKVAAVRLEEAKQTLHEATAADTIALAKRLCTARAKSVAELSECIQQYYKLTKKLREHNAKINAWWPNGGISPGGTLLAQREIMEAIANELCRVSRPADPLNREGWLLPGAHEPLLTGPNKEKPLIERIAIADARILELVSKAPAGATQ
jgi:hypothetical protein